MGLFLIDKQLENKYELLRNIINKYNKLLFKITKNNKGKVAIPNKDKIDIKKYTTLNQYLNHKKIWLLIYNTVNELNKNNIDIDEYFITLFKNWDNVRFILFIKEKTAPISNVIFSKKCINIYNRIKRNKEITNEKNKNTVVDKNIVITKFESNMIKLNNMIKQHKTLTDLEILNIFRNEFDSEFVEKYKKEKEE